MWIKICANTNLDDAALAAELGADALGFVFAPSPRRVTPQQVASITAQLPTAIEKIGVFYTLDLDEIVGTIRLANLTGTQLHGAYSPTLVAALASQLPALKIIQTIHWNTVEQPLNVFADQLAAIRSGPKIDAVLIDSRTANASGGTGISFDWAAARQALSALSPIRLIVAGGLNAANVQQAIATLDPWGVDVASGVESEPGRKAPQELAAFLSNARSASIVVK